MERLYAIHAAIMQFYHFNKIKIVNLKKETIAGYKIEIMSRIETTELIHTYNSYVRQ